MAKMKDATLIVLGIFALIVITTAASFAFFTYSRVGNNSVIMTAGDIEFRYFEGENATLPNAYPVADSVGAKDDNGAYEFEVSMASSSTSGQAKYNVILVEDNGANTNVFRPDQIKYNLYKNNVAVIGSDSTGELVSTVIGTGQSSGVALPNQVITANNTDKYKLRIWIDEDVEYGRTHLTDDSTDEYNDPQESNGLYNGYTYSLRVRITTVE